MTPLEGRATLQPGEAAAEPGLDRREAVGEQLTRGLGVRVARYPLQLLFVVAVPRLLGAETYGAYAACVASWALVAELTDPGVMPIFGRLGAGLPRERLSVLCGQLLWTRLVLAVGPGILLLSAIWTPRPEDPLLFGTVVAAVLLVPIQQVLFGILYARGKTARVMAREPLRSAISLGLVVPGYAAAGLVGAVWALALAQALLVALGFAWSRPALRDLRPPSSLNSLGTVLSFGLAAALPVTLTMAGLKVGVVLLAKQGRPLAEVGSFDLAVQVLAVVVALAAYPFIALLPALGRALDRGDAGTLDFWVDRVGRRSAAAALLLCVVLVLCGDALLGWVLGAEFSGLYRMVLVLIGVGLFPTLIIQGAMGLLVVFRRPHLSILPALAFAAAATVGTVLWGPVYGASGAVLALLGGMLLQALLLILVIPSIAKRLVWPILCAGVSVTPLLLLGTLSVTVPLVHAETGRVLAAAAATALPVAMAFHLLRAARATTPA